MFSLELWADFVSSGKMFNKKKLYKNNNFVSSGTLVGMRTYRHCEGCDDAGVKCGISELLLVQHFVLGDETIRITGLCPVQENGVSTSGPCCGHIHALWLCLKSKHRAPGAGGGALRVVGGDFVLVLSEWLEDV